MILMSKEDLLKDLGLSTNCASCPRYDGYCRGHLGLVCHKIDNAPEFDLIYCKECKYHEIKQMVYVKGDGYDYCNLIKGMTEPYGYCHMAERIEDD